MRWVKLLLLNVAFLSACATETTGPSQAEADPNRSVETHTRLAAGYYNIGRHKVAIDEANYALRINDRYAPAYNVLGLIYMALNDKSAAEDNFRKALAIAPEDSDINHNYGVFLCQTGREKDSIDSFLAAVKNPLYATPERSLANAGLCLRKLRQDAAAKPMFERALRTQPEDALSLFNLADIAYRSEDFPLAKMYLQRINPRAHSPESLLLGWRVERAIGNPKGEKQYADQLLRDFPTSSQAKQLQ